MSPIATWLDDLDAAGLAPTAMNGHHVSLCPSCRFEATLTENDAGLIDIACTKGCSRDQIVDSLHSLVERGGTSEEVSSYPGALGTTGKTTRPETAAQSHTGVSYSPSGRYDNRFVGLDEMSALLAKPPEPLPWRVHDFVADGTLTVIGGESGSGKSWLAQAFCTGVARGHAVAGLPCVKGQALYIDAEMGPRMFVDQRLRPAGVQAAEFAYVDAMGLDVSLPADLAWIGDRIQSTGANLAVIDSLRRLTPSKAENDSDDMAPVVGALAKLARDTGAAIVLVHHKGDGEKFSRGSTAIKDQADALFGLLRDSEDENAPRRLRCRGGRGKMRYAPEPPDVYLHVSPQDGGVAGSEAPDAPELQVPVRQALAQAIKAALPAATKVEVAQKVGRPRNDAMLANAWKDLTIKGEVVEINGVWQLSSYLQALGDDTKTTTAPGTS